MNRYWVSWLQTTEDYRPLTFPPNGRVLGWWCSGYRSSDDAATICALVAAETEDDAKAVILKDWPEADEWRFCDEVEPDWDPNKGGRFPPSEWSVERQRPEYLAALS